MAGTAFSTSCNLGRCWLVVKTHNVRSMPGKLVSQRKMRRKFTIKAEIKFVTADDAKELVKVDGYNVLDVRDKSQYERAHIKTCYHVPLFVENTDNDPGTFLLRTVHNNFSGLFFGIPFTRPNPDFVQSVKSQIQPETKLLIVCQEGLSAVETSVRECYHGGLLWLHGQSLAIVLNEHGTMTRSAAAANKLEDAGFQNVACITSGLQTVKPGTFESVGSTELQNAGKAGLVQIQGKISAVLGTVLICAYLFITFFPDQAEKLIQLVPAG